MALSTLNVGDEVEIIEYISQGSVFGSLSSIKKQIKPKCRR